jgi:hypothetical protein
LADGFELRKSLRNYGDVLSNRSLTVAALT